MRLNAKEQEMQDLIVSFDFGTFIFSTLHYIHFL